MQGIFSTSTSSGTMSVITMLSWPLVYKYVRCWREQYLQCLAAVIAVTAVTTVTMVIASTNFSSHPTARRSQPEQKGTPTHAVPVTSAAAAGGRPSGNMDLMKCKIVLWGNTEVGQYDLLMSNDIIWSYFVRLEKAPPLWPKTWSVVILMASKLILICKSVIGLKRSGLSKIK